MAGQTFLLFLTSILPPNPATQIFVSVMFIVGLQFAFKMWVEVIIQFFTHTHTHTEILHESGNVHMGLKGHILQFLPTKFESSELYMHIIFHYENPVEMKACLTVNLRT